MEYVADFSGIPNELKQFVDDRSMSLLLLITVLTLGSTLFMEKRQPVFHE